MARQITIHLVPAVFRKRIPLRAGSVHLYRRNCMGHSGVDSCGGTCKTIATINNPEEQGQDDNEGGTINPRSCLLSCSASRKRPKAASKRPDSASRRQRTGSYDRQRN